MPRRPPQASVAQRRPHLAVNQAPHTEVRVLPGALHVPVAQQDSARGSGPRGRPFESDRGCRGAGLAGREAVCKTADRVQLPPRLHRPVVQRKGRRSPKP